LTRGFHDVTILDSFAVPKQLEVKMGLPNDYKVLQLTQKTSPAYKLERSQPVELLLILSPHCITPEVAICLTRRTGGNKSVQSLMNHLNWTGTNRTFLQFYYLFMPSLQVFGLL
jgi:hypothetical protein